MFKKKTKILKYKRRKNDTLKTGIVLYLSELKAKKFKKL